MHTGGATTDTELERGLRALGVDVALAAPLLAYLDELLRWNRAFNLTAVRDPAAAVPRHLLDSLSLLPLLGPGDLLDVGTGAGLPGVPLALAEPQRRCVLLDSGGKKIRFVRHVALLLGLDNVTPVQARAEDYREAGSFGNVVSRAFADVGRFVALAGHLCAPDGRLLAMKGTDPTHELDALPAGFAVSEVHRVVVPGLSAQRHVVELRRTASAM